MDVVLHGTWRGVLDKAGTKDQVDGEVGEEEANAVSLNEARIIHAELVVDKCVAQNAVYWVFGGSFAREKSLEDKNAAS